MPVTSQRQTLEAPRAFNWYFFKNYYSRQFVDRPLSVISKSLFSWTWEIILLFTVWFDLVVLQSLLSKGIITKNWLGEFSHGHTLLKDRQCNVAAWNLTIMITRFVWLHCIDDDQCVVYIPGETTTHGGIPKRISSFIRIYYIQLSIQASLFCYFSRRWKSPR